MKKVLLLLANGFEVFEASVYVDVFGWNYLEGDKSTKLFTCARTREVKSSFDQRWIADFTLNEIDPADFSALAIPGGFEDYGFYKDAYSEDFGELIRRFHAAQKPISSICTGAFPIAKSGILSDRRGTTYNKNPKRQENLTAMGVLVQNEPIVVDGNVTTSWNPSTAMDVAFALLENLTDRRNVDQVRSLMGFD